MGQCSHGCPEPSHIEAGHRNVKSILDGVTIGMTEGADAHDPVVNEADEEIHKQVWETVILARVIQACVNLHVTD